MDAAEYQGEVALSGVFRQGFRLNPPAWTFSPLHFSLRCVCSYSCFCVHGSGSGGSEGRAILLIQPQRRWLASLEYRPSWYASIIPKPIDFLLEAILYRFSAVCRCIVSSKVRTALIERVHRINH